MTDHADDAERTARLADQLLDAACAGDVDAELRCVAERDAPAVLAAVIRGIAPLVASRQLLEGSDTTPALEPAPDGVEDPWSADDATTETLVAARLLWDALADQDDVAGLLAGVNAIDENEARAVVLERGLAAMIDRGAG